MNDLRTLLREAAPAPSTPLPTGDLARKAQRRRWASTGLRVGAPTAAVVALALVATSVAGGDRPQELVAMSVDHAPITAVDADVAAAPNVDGRLVTTGDGTFFVGSSGGAPAIWTTDGSTFTPTVVEGVAGPAARPARVTDLVDTDGGIVAVGRAVDPEVGDVVAAAWTSADGGQHWTRRPMEIPALAAPLPDGQTTPSSTATSVERLDTGALVAIGVRAEVQSTPQGTRSACWAAAWRSSNGSSWELETGIDARAECTTAPALTTGPTGALAIVSGHATGPTVLLATDRGWRTVPHTGLGQGRIESVAGSAGGYVAVGAEDGTGLAWFSDDGTSWHRALARSASPTAHVAEASFTDVVAGPSGWALTGWAIRSGGHEIDPDALVATSRNGTTWSMLSADGAGAPFEAGATLRSVVMDRGYVISGARVRGTGTSADPVRTEPTVWRVPRS